MTNKSYLNRVRKLSGDEVPSFMKRAVAIVKYQKRVNALKAKGAILFTETGFEKISWDMFQKTEEPDFGSIWVVTTIKNANDEEEKWLVVNVDENDKIIRSVKASIEKKAQEFGDISIRGAHLYNADFVSGDNPPVVVVIQGDIYVVGSLDSVKKLFEKYEVSLSEDELNNVEDNIYFDGFDEIYTRDQYVEEIENFVEEEKDPKERSAWTDIAEQFKKITASITKKAIIPGDTAMHEYEPGKFQRVFVAGIEDRDPETGENTFKVRPMWGGGEEHFIVEEKKLKSASVKEMKKFGPGAPDTVLAKDLPNGWTITLDSWYKHDSNTFIYGVCAYPTKEPEEGEDVRFLWDSKEVDADNEGALNAVETQAKEKFEQYKEEVSKYEPLLGHQYEMKVSKKTSHTPGAIVQVVIPQGGINEKYNGKVGEVVAAVPDRSKISFKDMPSLWFEDNTIRVVASCKVCGSNISLQSLKKLGKVECRCGAFYSWRQLERIAKTAKINKEAVKKMKKRAQLEDLESEVEVGQWYDISSRGAYWLITNVSSEGVEYLEFMEGAPEEFSEQEISEAIELNKKSRGEISWEEFKSRWETGDIDLYEDPELNEKRAMKKKAKIVEKGNEYCVEAESGRNMGCYATKSKAEKRLKQVEMFKHMGRSKKAQEDIGDVFPDQDREYWETRLITIEKVVEKFIKERRISKDVRNKVEEIWLSGDPLGAEKEMAEYLKDRPELAEKVLKTAQNVIFWFDDPKALKNLRYLQGPPTSPAGEEELLEKPGLEEEKVEGEEVEKEASKKTAQNDRLERFFDYMLTDEDYAISVAKDIVGDENTPDDDADAISMELESGDAVEAAEKAASYLREHPKLVEEWYSEDIDFFTEKRSSRVKKGERNFEVGDTVQIMDKEGNTNVVPKATIAKVDEYLGTDGQMHETVEVTGSTNEDEQMWYGEEDYQVVLLDPIEASKKKKTKVSTKIKEEAKEKIGSIVKEALEKTAQGEEMYEEGEEIMVRRDPNPPVKGKVLKVISPDVVEVEYTAPETGVVRIDRYYTSQVEKIASIKKKAQGGGQFEMLRGGGQGGSQDQLEPMGWQVQESKTPELPEGEVEAEGVEEVDEIVIRISPEDKSVQIDFEGEKEEEVEKPVGAEAPPEKPVEKPREGEGPGEEGLEEIPVNF